MVVVAVQPSVSSVRAYVDALLAYDQTGAEGVVDRALAGGVDIASVYTTIFQPALYELGAMWERSELTVAHEHYCTAATQNIMARLRAERLAPARTGLRLLATAIGGNWHAVGVRMVADLFELAGWTTRYLGASAATEEILAQLRTGEFDVLAISAALEEHVPAIAALITRIRHACPDLRTKILVGGRPFNIDLGRWRGVGADGHAQTPELAIRLAESLVPREARMRAPRLSIEPAARPPVVRPESSATEPSLAAMTRLNNELHDTTRALSESNGKLAQLNAQLNRFMGIAAHDLRNPLTAITVNAQVVREELEADGAVAELVESVAEIEKAGAFMKRLLDDLLDVARIRGAGVGVSREKVELTSFLREVIRLNEPLAARKSIVLRRVTGDSPVVLDVDKAKLQQVINNLVGNAVQYSHPGSHVDIALSSTQTEVVIEVRDHGQGIRAEELPKIFRPFETTSTRGTAGEKSTGLGLSIVQAIVESHGGTVRVASELGTGSTFFVTLPRVP